MIPRPLRELHHRLLPLFSFFKIKPLCRLGLNKLDRKIEDYLDFNEGVYIEAGANDGIKQSNTYYFDSIRKWSGLLIEPVPSIAIKCKKNRPRALVVNAGLVASDYPNDTIQIENAGLMSIVPDQSTNSSYDAESAQKGRKLQHIQDHSTYEVRAATLSQLIDEAGLTTIDLLSLDVEGYEAEVLKGLNMERHRPKYLCIEVRDESAILEIIGPYYVKETTLHDSGEHQDILYRARSIPEKASNQN